VRRLARVAARHDGLALALLLAAAAALRLPGIESRGRFEFDQGQDMLVLRAFVQDGVVPLLGPKTSVGVFHHGALEYFLLAPSAWLSGAEPIAVVLEFVLIGLAAVAATWWLGRVVGGPRVALVAGLLLAVSPAAVDESTFIWNPNPVPLFAAVAAAAAWRGRQTGRARWWALAVGCSAAVANLHILGAIFVPPIAALLVAEVRQWRRPDPGRAEAALRGAAIGLAAAVVIYLPLILSEVRTGFAESRAIADYIGSGGGGTATGIVDRLAVTALRVIGWPFVGLVTDAPALAGVLVVLVVGLLAWLAIAGRGDSGAVGRWIAGSVTWSIAALAVAAPSLASVVPGLPNDHYHSFADPLIVLGVALAAVELGRRAAAAWSGRRTGRRRARRGDDRVRLGHGRGNRHEPGNRGTGSTRRRGRDEPARLRASDLDQLPDRLRRRSGTDGDPPARPRCRRLPRPGLRPAVRGQAGCRLRWAGRRHMAAAPRRAGRGAPRARDALRPLDSGQRRRVPGRLIREGRRPERRPSQSPF
jgi:hypothetical protein